MNTGENRVVARITKALSWEGARRGGRSALALGIGDDAALIVARPGYQTILTCDWFLEGTHFLRDKHPADSVGWKCLARAVSDIAAMGGRPNYFLLSLGLPKTHAGRWLDQFLQGLRRAARHLGCQLAGGDTTRTDQILINVTVVGEVRKGRAVLRSGANPGDLVFVSGHLGEAELGLQRLRRSRTASRQDACITKHLYPEPRLALGQWLAEKRVATAMMDVSDGLSTDLARLCAASRVGARLEEDMIPKPQVLAAKAQTGLDLSEPVLHGGDDYELLFTVSRGKIRLIPSCFQGIPLTRIGEITPRRGVRVVQRSGREGKLIPRGWDAFRQNA
jgi:thiamine-monophosphate kinase